MSVEIPVPLKPPAWNESTPEQRWVWTVQIINRLQDIGDTTCEQSGLGHQLTDRKIAALWERIEKLEEWISELQEQNAQLGEAWSLDHSLMVAIIEELTEKGVLDPMDDEDDIEVSAPVRAAR